ncbi:MAG: excinuclease ABC subunit UvrB [Eubacteriaceae bacterium]
MKKFKVYSDFSPAGDQPAAIDSICNGIDNNFNNQTLLGVTGSGKTYTMAKIIERLQRPALVLAHNKTLAAQLCNEFKSFFPENAVEYFVSYYDYYQPEAYVPGRDIYIEKDADINDEIEKLRHSATSALFERRDVIVVASVSCIYGLGSPYDYENMILSMRVGNSYDLNYILQRLISMQYKRSDIDFARSTFRLRGDTLEIFPSYSANYAVRIEFFGDEIEKISEIHPVTGNVLTARTHAAIFPASHYVTSEENIQHALLTIEEELKQRVEYFRAQNKFLEAERLSGRTNYDIEMLRETGHCKGIENYTRHINQTKPGQPPYTLIDYFNKDFIFFIDESHVTLPQVRGMYGGDHSRKQNLVDYGFRLPSAFDNRPLKFDEFEKKLNTAVFVSATPSLYEKEHSQNIAELIVRPTGLLEPEIVIKPTKGQIDDLIENINKATEKSYRVLITTMTKRMAEDLTNYLISCGIKTTYMHSEVDTLDRIDIIKSLRTGVYDVLVGINLLREGLDIPEIGLVAILDADKEGFLRNTTSLIQTIGRAARNKDSYVILYADNITRSIKEAVEETNRRRSKQTEYNSTHGIEPKSIIKDVTYTWAINEKKPEKETFSFEENINILEEIAVLSSQMQKFAAELNFEQAAKIRDKIAELKKIYNL